MSVGSWLGQFAIASVLFLLLDLLWLGVVAQGLYERILGDLVAAERNLWAAVLFYVIFVAGLVFLVIGPAVEDGSPGRAALHGAVFGLVAYATWNLTNLAVLAGFPARIVPIDMAWGTLLTTAVSLGTYLVWELVAGG